jgi:quercetin dioxygenase-like cupin family protein
MTTAAPHRLRAGACFGTTQRRIDAGAFSIALMRPDPDLEVGLHTHDAGHIIVHLGGTYLSTAAGAPARAEGVLVVCNPPGVTHRDRYARRGTG